MDDFLRLISCPITKKIFYIQVIASDDNVYESEKVIELITNKIVIICPRSQPRAKNTSVFLTCLFIITKNIINIFFMSNYLIILSLYRCIYIINGIYIY